MNDSRDANIDGRADVNAGFAATLVDEWCRCGLTQAVIAPGSRSTPLAVALARDERVSLHVFHDERSAAFFALGLARATGLPAVVLCTSGTAAANFTPAVVEAHHARVPLLVCTADRPPELHDTGAPQTVDQRHMYGRNVRLYLEPGVPSAASAAVGSWRSLADRAWSEAVGSTPGPVHLNLAFGEPLVPVGAALQVAGAPGGAPWTAVAPVASRPASAAVVADLAAEIAAAPRGLLVAGWGSGASVDTAVAFAQRAGWPILADPISNLRVDGSVSTYDALVRSVGGIEPDLVVRLGAAPTSKLLTQWLDREVRQVLVDPYGAWLDPGRVAAQRIVADADLLLAALVDALPDRQESRWLGVWHRLEKQARRAIDDALDAGTCDEGRVARDVVAAAPDGSTIVVASSMPVRDVDAFAAPRRGVTFVSNRGANGIDGFTSTALGVAAGSGKPVVALMGDLCFLHDTNGLLGAADRGVDAVLVVVDNDGGGIFSFLPQAESLPAEFEQLFGTSHGLDLCAVAQSHGAVAARVEADVAGAEVRKRAAAGGVHVVVVPSNRAANVEAHRAIQRAVSEAL